MASVGGFVTLTASCQSEVGSGSSGGRMLDNLTVCQHLEGMCHRLSCVCKLLCEGLASMSVKRPHMLYRSSCSNSCQPSCEFCSGGSSVVDITASGRDNCVINSWVDVGMYRIGLGIGSARRRSRMTNHSSLKSRWPVKSSKATRPSEKYRLGGQCHVHGLAQARCSRPCPSRHPHGFDVCPRSGDTEIDQANGTIISDQNVLGSDVAVNRC